jgi:Regulator of chromosome condensation (RCC1) repeat/PASTA domain
MHTRTSRRLAATPAAVAVLSGAAGLASAGPAGAATAAAAPGTRPSLAAPVAFGWGNNESEQVGDGTAAERDAPVTLTLGGTPVQVAGMGLAGAVLLSNGTVQTPGADDAGQLGNGTFNRNASDPVPTVVPGLSGITQIAAGDDFVLALSSAGTVPEQVAGLTGVTQIASGDVASFAVSGTAQLFAGGAGQDGVLGTGDGADKLHPTLVGGLPGVIRQVASSGLTTLAIVGPGRDVYGWGFNSQGQIGDGTTVRRLSPEKTALTGISGVSAGLEVSAAITAGGSLLVWGFNANGSVANGTSRTNQLVPAAVAGITNATSVSVSSDLGLAVGRVPLPPPPTSGPVPNVTGDLRAAAITTIQGAGFSLGTVGSSPDKTCNNIGHVLSQNPPAGTNEPFGTAVSIVIGTRPATPCP